MQNPSRSQLLAFSLLLVNTPARRHKLWCLFLSVLIFARASTLRLADLRARVPIGTRGHIFSRIGYLIPNRKPHNAMVSLSAQRIISPSTHHNQHFLDDWFPCPAKQLPHFGHRRNELMAISPFDFYSYRIVASYGQNHHPDNLFVDHPGAFLRCTLCLHVSAQMRTNRSESLRLV